MFKNTARIVRALLALFALHAAFWFDGGRYHLVVHRTLPDQFLGFGEVFLALLLLAFALPAAHWIARTLQTTPHLRVRCRSWFTSRWVLLIPAAVAALGAFCIAQFVHDYAWFTDDEQAYLYQAKSYLDGSLTGPILEPHGAFRHRYVVALGPEGAQRWAGVYPVLQPFLMSLSMRLGSAHLAQFLIVGVLVYNAARFAETWLRSRRVGRIVAGLCATSPMLLGLGSTYHTAVLAAALSVISARLLLWCLESGHWLRSAALGSTAGTIVLARPMEGTLMVLLCGLFLLGWSVRSTLPTWRRLSTLCGYGLGGLVPFSIFVVVNINLTGEWFAGPYKLLEGEIGPFFGFGMARMFGRTHSVWHGISQTVSALLRMNNWLFAWPVSLVVPLLALLPPLRNGRVLLLLGVSAVQLSAYFFLAFGSVHDFGSAYHVWHLGWLATATAWVIECASERLGKWCPAEKHYPRLLGVSFTLVGLATFWPAQIQKWWDVGRVVKGPIVEAERVSGNKPAIVLWNHIQPPGQMPRSWVFCPPAPYFKDTILWARDHHDHYRSLKKNFPERAFYRLTWDQHKPVITKVTLP
jgi:hypothetical protein